MKESAVLCVHDLVYHGHCSHSEVSWKTISVFLSNRTMELVLGRSLDPLYCTAL